MARVGTTHIGPGPPFDHHTVEGGTTGVRVQYTITEYDSEGDEIHQEHGEDRDVRYGDVEDYARGLVTDWVPVDGSAETWRARVRDEDGNRAEAVGPQNEAWRIEPAPLPDGRALAAELVPLISKLRTIVEPLAVRDDLPALYQLLPQVAAAAAAVQAALGTAGAGDPYDTGAGRANLEAVQARAQRLAATAAQALADERSGR
jgi:hypothetical protein